MKKYIIWLCVVLPLAVQGSFIECDTSVKNEVITLVKSKNFRDTKSLEILYEKCKDDFIFMLLSLSRADNLEDVEKYGKAFKEYKTALNALALLKKDIYGVSELKAYLIEQLDKYGSIDADTISQRHIGTRGSRGAELAIEKKLPISLNFEYDSSEIKAGVNLTQVSNITKALSKAEYRDKVIYINGHTDTRGKPEYNAKLGKRRALALKMYLQKKGGLVNIIIPESEGEKNPICLDGKVVKVEKDGYKCTGGEDYYSSRRVEITIGEK